MITLPRKREKKERVSCDSDYTSCRFTADTIAMACYSSPTCKDSAFRNATCFSSAAPIDTRNRKLRVTVVKNLAESTKRRIDSTLFATVWIISRNMRDNHTGVRTEGVTPNQQKSDPSSQIYPTNRTTITK